MEAERNHATDLNGKRCTEGLLHDVDASFHEVSVKDVCTCSGVAALRPPPESFQDTIIQTHVHMLLELLPKV